MKAVLLISHGSRSPKTKKEVKDLVKILKQKTKIKIFEYAFLEIEHPSIPEGIADCVQQGARRIIILLNFLNSGRHVDIDVPRIVHETMKTYPKVSFKITKPVGQHPKIAALFSEMI